MELPPGQQAREDFPRFGLPPYANRFPTELVSARITIALNGVDLPAVDLLEGGFETVTLERDLHCVTTWSHLANRWTGVRLRELCERCLPADHDLSGPKAGAIFRAQDGYKTSLPLEDLLHEDVLLATALDGEPLTVSHGAPVRQQTGSDFQGNQFDPNLTESAEVGFKTDLGQFFNGIAGSVTVTAFQVDQSNILVNDDRPEAVAAGFFSRSAGEARSRGLEIDAALSTESGFNFWLSYAYVDAEFTTSAPDADFGAPIEEGDPLINAPEHQLNVQASKSFRIGAVEAQFGGGVLYTGERLGFTGFDFFLPSYTVARIFGQVQLAQGLALRVDVDNLFDETFYTNSFADVWVEPGAPRRYRITAAYSF